MSDTNNILLADGVQPQIDRIRDSNAHAILLVGNAGAGKGYLARHLASYWLGVDLERISSHQSVMMFDDKLSSLGIEEVRQISNFLQLKTLGNTKIRRVIIIENADRMTHEAQNAILKSLEEPPEDTRLVFTSSNILGLKTTVLSRLQKVNIKSVNQEQAVNYFLNLGYSEGKIQEAFRISNGAVGLMHAILDEADSHNLAVAIQYAKQLLGESAYERLLRVEELGKNRQELLDVLTGLKLIARSGLSKADTTESQNSLRWKNILRSVLETENAIAQNANSKLALTNLVITL